MKLAKKDLAILLTAAGRAPSGGNIQPWLVEVENNQLTVHLNPQKFGTVLDANNYGSLFSLGAFSLNLEIASSHLGLKYHRTLHQTNSPNEFHVTYTYEQKVIPQSNPLFKAVLARDTNRHLHEGKILPESVIKAVSMPALQSYPYFRLDSVSTSPGRDEMANILGKADMIRTKNTVLCKQMLSEIRWTNKDTQATKDGIDIKTMELPGNVGKMLQLLSKFASLAKNVPDIALEKQAWPMLKFSSHVCVLSFKGQPTPLNFFEAGYVMEHLWLEATHRHLAVHPWTVLSFFAIRAKYFSGSFFSPNEEKLLLETDKRLRKLIALPSTFTPAFIFRISVAKSPSTRSLRYDWQKYTTIHS